MENYQDIVSPFSSFLSPLLTRRRSNSLLDFPTKLPKLSIDGYFNKLDLEFSNEKNPKFEKHIHVYEQIAPTACSYNSEFSLVESSCESSRTSKFDPDFEEEMNRVSKRIRKSKISSRRKLTFPGDLIEKLDQLKSKRSPKEKNSKEPSTEAEVLSSPSKAQRKLSRAQTVKAQVSLNEVKAEAEELKLRFLVKFDFDKGPKFEDLSQLPLKLKSSSAFEQPGRHSTFPLNLEELIREEQEEKFYYMEEDIKPKKKKTKKSSKKNNSNSVSGSSRLSQKKSCSFKKALIARKKSKLLNIRSNIVISRLIDNLSEMDFISNYNYAAGDAAR